jgi:hypothetical protein
MVASIALTARQPKNGKSKYPRHPHEDGRVLLSVSVPEDEALLLEEIDVRTGEQSGAERFASLLIMTSCCEFARVVKRSKKDESYKKEYPERLWPIIELYWQYDKDGKGL